jgi:hypothetical protein
MTKFSALKAALSGIDFIKNNQAFAKKFVLIYAGVYTLYYLALAQIGYFTDFAALTAVFQGGDMQEYAQAAQAKQAPQLILALLSFAAYLALCAAALRKMLRNEEVGLWGISWGKDENRMLLSLLILLAMLIGLYLVLIIPTVIISVPLLLRDANNPQNTAMVVGIILLIVMPFFAVFMVRFSQYGVLTIAKRKVAVMDSWRETKGQFWSYFGAHLLVYLAMMAVMCLGWFLAIKGFAGGNEPKNALEFLHPLIIIPTIVIFAIVGLLTLCANSVGAYAFYITHNGEGVVELETEKQDWPI